MCLELSLTRPKSHSEKAKVEHTNITAIKSQVSLNCWNNVSLLSLSVLCVSVSYENYFARNNVLIISGLE